MTRHLYKELVLEVFGHFGVLETVLIRDGLQQGYLLFVMRMELTFVVIEESVGFREELFQYHVQVEANEDGEKYAHELRLELIETLIDENLQLREAFKIIIRIPARVHVLVFGCLCCILPLSKQCFVIFHESL